MNFTRIEEITRQWGEWLNLEKAFDDLTPISLCLDAQRRLNEMTDFPVTFKRCNIPLVIRVFRESKAYKKNYFVNFEEGEKPEIYLFNTKWSPPKQPEDRQFSLDIEANYLAECASAVTKEFDALFSDMSNESITFHGFGCLKDGTLTLAFSR
jgi:hypothetical protein